MTVLDNSVIVTLTIEKHLYQWITTLIGFEPIALSIYIHTSLCRCRRIYETSAKARLAVWDLFSWCVRSRIRPSPSPFRAQSLAWVRQKHTNWPHRPNRCGGRLGLCSYRTHDRKIFLVRSQAHLPNGKLTPVRMKLNNLSLYSYVTCLNYSITIFFSVEIYFIVYILYKPGSYKINEGNNLCPLLKLITVGNPNRRHDMLCS